VEEAADLARTAEIIARVAGAPAETDPGALRVGAPVADRVGALTRAVRALDDAGVTVADIGLRRPTLDEVFLHLTGHRPGSGERPGRETAVPQSKSTEEAPA
jgi:ABC-2 type transport system ATP-binding protein